MRDNGSSSGGGFLGWVYGGSGRPVFPETDCVIPHAVLDRMKASPPANGGGHTINVTVRNDSGGEIDVSRRAHARGVILELMRRGKP